LDDFQTMTFKIFLPSRGVLAQVMLLLMAGTGCRTLGPLPPADLKEPGWTVRQGQAVWKRPHGAVEIAGDVLVAWRDGRSLVQFSKSPFSLVVCQTTPRGWEITIPVENRRYSGPGRPPRRMIWLQLPFVLEGRAPPRGWAWTMTPDNNWSLKNGATGESIEGYFSQ